MMFLCFLSCFIVFLSRVRIGFYGVLTCRLVDFLRTEIETEHRTKPGVKQRRII
jgi:hypothetical protein